MDSDTVGVQGCTTAKHQEAVLVRSGKPEMWGGGEANEPALGLIHRIFVSRGSGAPSPAVIC